MGEETDEQRAERVADVLTDRAWVVCNCVIELGYADADCPHCDGQGGWPADEDKVIVEAVGAMPDFEVGWQPE